MCVSPLALDVHDVRHAGEDPLGRRLLRLELQCEDVATRGLAVNGPARERLVARALVRVATLGLLLQRRLDEDDRHCENARQHKQHTKGAGEPGSDHVEEQVARADKECEGEGEGDSSSGRDLLGA